jgi:hypothetical protein
MRRRGRRRRCGRAPAGRRGRAPGGAARRDTAGRTSPRGGSRRSRDVCRRRRPRIPPRPEHRQRLDRADEHVRCVAAPPRSPMCGLSTTRSPVGHGDRVFHVRADADERLPRGGPAGVQFGVGAYPRARRRRMGWPARVKPDDRVVHRPGDGAVVAEKQIGDPGQPCAGLGVIGAERFLRQVCTGGDQRAVHRPASRRCSGDDGSRAPTHGLPGATPAASGRPALAGRSTIGACGDCSQGGGIPG